MVITMVRSPAGGYCCSKECLLVVIACVGGVLDGGHPPLDKNRPAKEGMYEKKGTCPGRRRWAAVNYVSFSAETKYTQTRVKKRKERKKQKA
jgi:hypothetical protein